MLTANDFALIATLIYLGTLIPTLAWLLSHYRQRPVCPRPAGQRTRWAFFQCCDETVSAAAT